MNYKDSLNLPKTAFPMRAGLPLREPRRLIQWEQAEIYQQLRQAQSNRPEFILHDGPPFANGDAHMGHALNMTLKDIVLKSRNMSGFSAPFIPGWDCHGLPIEHKVMKELSAEGDLTPVKIRAACRAMAEKFIAIQRTQFQRLGVFGEWEHPYITMDPAYEADVLRVFAGMVEKGWVYQALKPVHWSTGCQTALAEAEVEYADRTDISVTVRFILSDASCRSLKLPEQTSLLIWTTTPWTLPANLAVAVNPSMDYSVVQVPGSNAPMILASARCEAVAASCNTTWTVQRTLRGAELVGAVYFHPFLDREGVVHEADFVTSESGTGLVHIAPGHGHDDYQLGQRVGLDVLSPVDDSGVLTAECGMPQWIGLNVFDANPVIAKHLESTGHLLGKESYRHSYPHCWRSKTPIVFRSVTQWFIRVEAFRQDALEAIGRVRWIPAWGENRIRGAVESRPDWCISRQRTWGIPIPAFTTPDGEAKLDADTIRRFADLVETEGTDMWFSADDATLCKRLAVPEDWRKGADTLDVWIDSGSSHQAVTRRRLSFPADLYLEGSDQHRGWFQSSLLTSVALTGEAPFRSVLTNGFVVDLDGKKISKSNTYEKPTDLMSFVEQYGADILRLWVSSEDYRNDVPFSDEIFKRVADTYRSMRNSFRILLANLSDFDPSQDAVALDQLTGVDRAIFARLQELVTQVRAAYDAYEFHQVYHHINRFCAVDLSALYIDVTKDRMYCDAVNSPRRRATQTVMHACLDALCRLLAPIMPFTCEEVWQFAVSQDPEGADAEVALLRESVHLTAFPEAIKVPHDSSAWESCLALRASVNEKLEVLRRDKKIGKSLEAVVVLPRSSAPGFSEAELAEFLIVSAAEFHDDDTINVMAASERGWVKCPRCWSYHPPKLLGGNAEHPELCPRCTSAVIRQK